MAGQKTPDDDPNTEPPADDEWSSPPPPPPAAWGPDPAQPPLPPWAMPTSPSYGAAPPGLPGSPPYIPPSENDPAPPPYGPPPQETERPAPRDSAWQEPPETQEWAPQPQADPWRIPPQPVWDPSVEPSPAAPPPPYGAAEEEPPTAPRFPAYDAGGANQPAALDLPPSAMVPRSTPRPPVAPERESRTSGEHGTVRFDEPWRMETPGRAGRRTRLRPILIGVAGLAVAGLVATGIIVFSGNVGKKKQSATAAQLAGGLFPIDPAAKTDGRDQELLGVAAVNSTVVAIGGELDHGDYRGQFIVSTDGGRSFRLATVRTPEGWQPRYGDAPQQVTGTDGAWVALGVSPTGGVVWTSRNGTDWTRQPDSAGEPFSGSNRLAQITRTTAGFVAVGTTSAKGDFSDMQPVVWRSTDGRRWDRISADQLKISGKGERATLDGVAANGDTVVAHGWTASGPKKSDIREGFWRSTDGGANWGSISTPHPDGNGLTVGAAFLAFGPGGFLIGRDADKKGGGGSPYCVLMSSADGQRWASAGEIHVSGYGRLLRLTGSDQGWTATVATGSSVTVQRSADGRSWAGAGTVPMPGGRTLTGTAVTSGATVLVGRDGTAEGNNAVLAVRDLHGQEVGIDLTRVAGAVRTDQSVNAIASAGGQLVAVGNSNGDAAVWTSSNGRQWNRGQAESKAFARPGPQQLTGLASGGAGWVAVGFSGAAPRRPLVVTSPDGKAWKAVDGDKAFEPGDPDQIDTASVTAGPTGYVIVGDQASSAAVWQSADLKTWTRGEGTTKDALDGSPGAERWMRSVVSGPFGYVAVGGLNDPSVQNAPRGRPAVWTSADGKRWALQQLPLPAGMLEATFHQVAIRQNVLTAAGTAKTSAGTTVFAFTSVDGGKTWRQVPLPPGSGGRARSAVTVVTATPRGFVIGGSMDVRGGDDVIIWTSSDGLSWKTQTPQGTGLSGPGDQWLTGMAVTGKDLLSVGVTRDDRGGQPTLWRRALP
ncbi:hypothetical protein [Actinoallomurus vinaceus]|uniref:hypothetical protein n=1 Tax=Actinoallomurus vinaceus TaxID=1080074 RepID=UPI0031EC699C